MQQTLAPMRRTHTIAGRIIWAAFVLGLVCASLSQPANGQATRDSRGRKASSAWRQTAAARTLEEHRDRAQMTTLLERLFELDRKLEAGAETAAVALRRIEELEQRLNETEKRAADAEQSIVKLLAHQNYQPATPNAENVELDPTVPVGQEIGRPKTRIQVEESAISQTDVPSTQPGAITTDPRAARGIRFSGDFRLRTDAIFRQAPTDPLPGESPLPRAQDIRARYRLRLNLDSAINDRLSFHGQLSTGPLNDPLTADQDFTATVTRHPITISEAWVDYRPAPWVQLQGGRVREVFADGLRFLFDDDVRFNGFNESFRWTTNKSKVPISIDARAGQYIFSSPDVFVASGNKLAVSPLVSKGAAMLFHQGVLASVLWKNVSSSLGVDLQLYRNPSLIQFASTPEGVPIIVQNGLGIALSGPLPGTGNATTTPNGLVYKAPRFQIARLTYTLNLNTSSRYPIFLNFQAARNIGIALEERDALHAAIGIGRIRQRGDQSFLYLFTLKGANSLISQLTDNDLGTGSGVNIRAHHFRYTLGLARNVFFQSLFFTQRALRNSDPLTNFFVPLNAFAPRTYRFQQQLVFTF